MYVLRIVSLRVPLANHPNQRYLVSREGNDFIVGTAL